MTGILVVVVVPGIVVVVDDDDDGVSVVVSAATKGMSGVTMSTTISLILVSDFLIVEQRVCLLPRLFSFLLLSRSLSLFFTQRCLDVRRRCKPKMMSLVSVGGGGGRWSLEPSHPCHSVSLSLYSVCSSLASG